MSYWPCAEIQKLEKMFALPARPLAAKARPWVRQSLLRPDDSLRALAEPPRDLDRLATQDELGRVEQYLVLRRPDLRLDGLDSEVFLLSADQPGDPIPDRRRALVGVHRQPP